MRLSTILLTGLAAFLFNAGAAGATDYVVRDRTGRVVGTLDDKPNRDAFVVRDRFGQRVGVARPTDRWQDGRRQRDWDRFAADRNRSEASRQPYFLYPEHDRLAAERYGNRGFDRSSRSQSSGNGVYLAPGLRN